MARPDYRGARGSNAGDDFHELWVLRHALTLLDQDTTLSAITVEGLMAEDEEGLPQDTWDGVDCTFYYGGDCITSVEQVVIDQLKYSSSNPDQAWTVSRLAHSTNKKRDNSVVGRLAKAFTGIKAKRPDLIEAGKVTIRLVSNQKIAPDVIEVLSNLNKQNQSSWKTFRASSGLSAKDFDSFLKTLDLTQCGRESRFALEERVLATISDWIDDDARVTVDVLLRFIRNAMMPEAKNQVLR